MYMVRAATLAALFASSARLASSVLLFIGWAGQLAAIIHERPVLAADGLPAAFAVSRAHG